MRGQGRVVSMSVGKETDRRSGSKGVSRYGRAGHDGMMYGKIVVC